MAVVDEWKATPAGFGSEVINKQQTIKLSYFRDDFLKINTDVKGPNDI